MTHPVGAMGPSQQGQSHELARSDRLQARHPSALQVCVVLLAAGVAAYIATPADLVGGSNLWLLIVGVILAIPYVGICMVSPILAWVIALSLVLLPELQSGQAGPGVGLADAAFIILITVRLLRRLLDRVPVRVPSAVQPFFVFATAYALLAALSSLYAAEPALAIKDSIKWIEIIAVAWVTKDLVSDLTDLRVAILSYWGVFVTGAAVAAIARLAVWTSGQLPYVRGGGEAGSLAAIVAIAILWTYPSKSLRTLARVVALLGIFVIAVSFARQSIVSLFLASVAMFAVTSKRKGNKGLLVRNTLFVGIATILVLSALPSDIRAFLDERVASFDLRQPTASNLARSSLLSASLDMWRNQPVGGVGAGNFAVAMSNYELPGVPFSARASIGPHDWFLTFAAETGAIGLLLFLAMIGSITGSALKLPVETDDSHGSVFMTVALVGIWTHWLTTFVVADITGSTRLSLAATVGLIAAATTLLRASRRESLTHASGYRPESA